jgi:hypothetical protein
VIWYNGAIPNEGQIMTATPEPPVHICECETCRAGSDPEIASYHQQVNLFLSRLTEPQRRWYAATLSQQANSPSDSQLSLITGLDEKTIQRGRHELQDGLPGVPSLRRRRPGGGRLRAEKKTQP